MRPQSDNPSTATKEAQMSDSTYPTDHPLDGRGAKPAQHTPGPWTVPVAYWADIEGADGTQIATLHSDGDVDGAPDAFTAQANARLIAAAPDMLAALDLHLALYADAKVSRSNPNASFVDTRDLEAAAAAARAALAKARGA
jgi:hypothetical protein